MTPSPHDLYELLPSYYRFRDELLGGQLRALLGVINEQTDAVDADIALLYDNWFIETCQEWVVPYLGDLVGYRPVHEAGDSSRVETAQGVLRDKILVPRREVANTLRFRRRKGTVRLLEDLARSVAGWPARAVEFYRLLSITQSIANVRPKQGTLVDLRKSDALDRVNGPFDELSHLADVRRINSRYLRGRHNIPSVGLFVCRLRSYSVTGSSAYCVEDARRPGCYTFSVLGNDVPLFVRPEPSPPAAVAGELHLPVLIRRRAFEDRPSRFEMKPSRAMTSYFGPNKSVAIWTDDGNRDGPMKPVTADKVIPADLKDWQYDPPQHHVAVDPERGRIAFPARHPPERVTVLYHYGFSADLGGGEYDRAVSQAAEAVIVPVRGQDEFETVLDRWTKEQPPNAVIEFVDSGVYVPPSKYTRLTMTREDMSLQIRAAVGCRPVIRLLDYKPDARDAFRFRCTRGSRLTLDGLLITGRGIAVESGGPIDDAAEVVLRHCTLVPGWAITAHCKPRRPLEPSLEIATDRTPFIIEHCILGTIEVQHDTRPRDPFLLRLTDSILDATGTDLPALEAPGCAVANVRLTVLRSTILGGVKVHAIDLAENSIFDGLVFVARRQQGCMRFCYVKPRSDRDPTVTARTPRRYNCQPDLAGDELRVRPHFHSVHYGSPTYCQLADTCPVEIATGADDEAEMGAFHDLFQPQRAANLHARLEEFTPAATDVGVIHASEGNS